MGNVKKQKIPNNEQDDTLIIKFQIQENIKKPQNTSAYAEQCKKFIRQKDSPYSLWKTSI